MHSHCAMFNVCVYCAKMPSARRLLAAVPSEEGVPIVRGGMSGSGVRSSRMSISRPLLTAKLCRMQHAPMIWHTKFGEYNRVPPDLSRHRKRDFRRPKVCSTTPRVCVHHCIFALLGFGDSGIESGDGVQVHMPRHLEGKRQEDVSRACAPRDVCIMGSDSHA